VFDATETLTVATVAKDLARVTAGNYTATYFKDDGTEHYTMTVKHTVPPAGKYGESHLLRVDCDYHDAEGLYLRRESAWIVLRSEDAAQNSTTLDNLAQALIDFCSDAIIDQLVGREA
jgi:hypothetical protein